MIPPPFVSDSTTIMVDVITTGGNAGPYANVYHGCAFIEPLALFYSLLYHVLTILVKYPSPTCNNLAAIISRTASLMLYPWGSHC